MRECESACNRMYECKIVSVSMIFYISKTLVNTDIISLFTMFTYNQIGSINISSSVISSDWQQLHL